MFYRVLFLAQLSKGHINFCHHLAFVIRCLLTFHIESSPLKLLGQMYRNLVGGIYGRSSIKLLISSQSIDKPACHRQFLFLVGQFLKIFSETACLNEPNFVDSIYGRSSMKIAHFVLIH